MRFQSFAVFSSLFFLSSTVVLRLSCTEAMEDTRTSMDHLCRFTTDGWYA